MRTNSNTTEEKPTVVIRPGSVSMVGDMRIRINWECYDEKSVAEDRADRDRLIVVGSVKYIGRGGSAPETTGSNKVDGITTGMGETV